MIWKITAYNGTTETYDGFSLGEAVDYFLSKFALTIMDIKLIENLH